MNSSDFVIFSKRFKEALILAQDDGVILSCNPAASKLFHLPNTELVGKNFFNITTDSKEKVQRYLLLWKSSGDFLPGTFVIRNESKENIECTIEGCLLQPKTNNNPALLMLRCIAKSVSTKRFLILNEKIQQLSRQIHERSAIELGLRESEEKFKLLLHSTAEAIYGVNHLGWCTFANSAFLKLLGFTSEQQVIGKNMHQLIHYSRLDGGKIYEHESPIFKAYNYAKEVYVDHAIVWKENGEPIPVEYWARPIRRGKKNDGAVITILDTTEKRQIDQVLRTLAQSTSGIMGKQFFDNCAKGLGEITKAKFAIIGTVNQTDLATLETLSIWNQGNIEENTTYTIDKTPCSTVMSGNPSFIPDEVSRLFPEDSMLMKHELKSYYGFPLQSSDNRILGIVAILDNQPMSIDDRTSSLLQVFAKRIAMELEQRESAIALQHQQELLESQVAQRTRELEHAFRDLESYSYSIAHDLRSPLRSITSFSQILYNDMQDRLNDNERDYFDRIIKSSQFMAELIKDILELARISRSDMQKSEICLSQIFRKILKERIQHFPERKFSITIKDNVFVRGDPSLFYIFFDNLIDNAIKFSHKKAETSIEFGCDKTSENQLICFVKDKGAGFNSDYKDKLFSPFQRLHSREEFEGTGIGLATVKRILERHGGEVWVESQVDKGACFYFTCPDLTLENGADTDISFDNKNPAFM